MVKIPDENEGSRSRYRLWQNAVPIQKLREADLDDERLKVLMAERYVEHGVETTHDLIGLNGPAFFLPCQLKG
jgi:hypothetical protein